MEIDPYLIISHQVQWLSYTCRRFIYSTSSKQEAVQPVMQPTQFATARASGNLYKYFPTSEGVT